MFQASSIWANTQAPWHVRLRQLVFIRPIILCYGNHYTQPLPTAVSKNIGAIQAYLCTYVRTDWCNETLYITVTRPHIYGQAACNASPPTEWHSSHHIRTRSRTLHSDEAPDGWIGAGASACWSVRDEVTANWRWKRCVAACLNSVNPWSLQPVGINSHHHIFYILEHMLCWHQIHFAYITWRVTSHSEGELLLHSGKAKSDQLEFSRHSNGERLQGTSSNSSPFAHSLLFHYPLVFPLTLSSAPLFAFARNDWEQFSWTCDGVNVKKIYAHKGSLDIVSIIMRQIRCAWCTCACT